MADKHQQQLRNDAIVGATASQKNLKIVFLNEGKVVSRTKQLVRTNSEMINPWSKEALLQKYSIRQSSKASLLNSVRNSLQCITKVEKSNHHLNTIRSYHEKASSLHARGTTGVQSPPVAHGSGMSPKNGGGAHHTSKLLNSGLTNAAAAISALK